jgi:hypothetical protein
MPGKRISLELPEHLVDRLDQLRREWHARSRGACLERLLEEIFEAETEVSSAESPDDADFTANNVSSSDGTDPVYDEDRAIVLVGSRHQGSTVELDEPINSAPPPPDELRDPTGVESIFQALSEIAQPQFEPAWKSRIGPSTHQWCQQSAKANCRHGLIQRCNTG